MEFRERRRGPARDRAGVRAAAAGRRARVEPLEGRRLFAAVSWVNPAGGSFTAASNWNTGQVPGPGDDVSITLDGTYRVDLNAGNTRSVRSLTLGGSVGTQTLRLTDSALSVSSASAVNARGELIVGRSTFGGAGTLTNAGTLRGRGLNAQVTAPFDTTATSQILVEGGGSPFAQTRLVFANGFTNRGAIELTNAASSFAFDAELAVSAGTLTNAPGGVIRSLPGGLAGGARRLLAAVDNRGRLDVHVATSIEKPSAAHANTGTIDLSPGGDLTVVQSGAAGPAFTSAGVIDIPAGRTFGVRDGTFHHNADAVVGGGGTLQLDGVTVNLNRPLSNAAVDLLIDGATVNGPATLTNAAGKTLRLGREVFFPSANAAVRQTVVNAPLVNNGTLLSRGHADRVSGAFTSGAGSTIRVEGNNTVGDARLTFADGFANNGTIDMAAVDLPFFATLAVTAGTLTNAPGRSINTLPGPVNVNDDGRNIYATVDNRGTINVGETTLIERAGGGGQHTNSGTIDVDGGDLTVSAAGMDSGSVTNTGTIAVAAGRTFTVANGTLLNNPGGTVLGAGTAAAETMNGATVSPGFPAGWGATTTTAVLALNADYTQNAGGTLDIQIAGTTAGTQYDRLAVTGDTTLSGALNVSLVGFTPTAGQVFTILTRTSAGPISGTFAGLPEGGTVTSAAGGAFRVSYVGGDGNDVTLSFEGGGPPPPATVAGRHLFYNNSGYDSGAAGDDGAVDAGKSALLPGGTASAANVTSYSRGVNGIMIDVTGLPAGTIAGNLLGENDVAVRTTSAAAPGAWSAGPAPSSATVRPGPNGTHRVTLIWPDGAIVNRWLEVTLLANADTGLAAADVFQFGSLVGDADGTRTVNLGDFGALRQDFGRTGLTVANGRSDFNRDGSVNLADFGLLRGSFGKSVPTTPPARSVPVGTAASPSFAAGLLAAADADVDEVV